MSDSSSEAQQEQPSYSFGKRLASARGALNLSREEVSKQLRLGVDIIVALEEEDYTKLTVPIFVNGYLRNYAGLLKIPAEPLLAAYSQIQVESPILVADAARKPKASYSKLLVKTASLLIVLVLIAGIISWVQSQDFDFSSLSDFNNQKLEPESVEPVAALVPLPELIEESELPIDENIDLPEVAVEVAVEEVVIEEPVPLVADVVAAPEVKKVPEPLVVKNKALIVVSEDSWVEVSDSDGKRLIYDLLRANKEYLVSGSTPFKVFLGNAKAVRIEYNGELINLGKYTRGNLARFRLGAAGE
ncbi:MAG: DUF4115 domain-containing protein [Sulfuriflexus sp.]|nr:DUF4115 domain-containing protein [Sulfuriflexus sp.]